MKRPAVSVERVAHRRQRKQMSHPTITPAASMTTPDTPPETEEQILARLLAPIPYSLPKPIPTPRLDPKDARRARKVFVKDGGY